MGYRVGALCAAVFLLITLTSAANAGTFTYEIKAFIDSHDDLVIQGNTLMWDNLDDGAVPGRWNGNDYPTTISSTVNGTPLLSNVDWMPVWPTTGEVRYPTDSSVFTTLAPALPAYDVAVTLLSADGPMPVTIGQNPDASNNYTLKVHFQDDVPDAHWYDVKIGVTYTNPFLDVPPDFWALSQIQACAAAGIVSGFSDGTYRPATPVTRDQMAVYISRAVAGSDAAVPAGPTTPTFTDVPTTDWAFRYVEYAKSLGIVSGYSPTTYAPSVPVTRDQMAVFVARAIASPTGEGGLATYTPPTAPSFPDVPTDFWAYKYIEYVKQAGVVTGYPDGTYQPANVVTRDQMAVYVARAFKLQ